MTLDFFCFLLIGLGILGVAFGVGEGVTSWREWHHLYFVPVILLVALVTGHSWICFLGAYLALDDGCEHVVAAIRHDPAKAWSPLYSYVLPFVWRYVPGAAALGRLLDRLLGKPV